MADREGGSGFAIGFLVGAALGLAVGFLFAPRAGEETRELLKEKAEDVREQATEVVQKKPFLPKAPIPIKTTIKTNFTVLNQGI